MTTTRPGAPDFLIDRPIMRQRWEDVTFLHWPVPITQVAARLPAGLAVDTFDGHAWVGVVPFAMVDVRFRGMPTLPWLGSFPETNVRTYVIGPDGPGVWFHSLDISRLAPVAIARAGFGLPYNWARMHIARRGDVIEYEMRRRWPERNAASRIAIAIGRPIDTPNEMERFFSARWRLYTMLGNTLATAQVSHEPWPLHAAHGTAPREDLVELAGYAPFNTPPHVMFSPGVAVSIEGPRRLR